MQGNPWGELMALQATGHDDRGGARIRELITRCLPQILGPLSPILSREGLAIRHGFLERADVWWQDHQQLAELGDLSWWNTVRHIRSQTSRDDAFAQLANASLLHVRRLGDDAGEEVARLARIGAITRLQRLDVAAPSTPEALCAASCWPELREFGCNASNDPQIVADMLQANLPLERLHLSGSDAGAFRPWLRAHAAGALPRELFVCPDLDRPHWQLQLTLKPNRQVAAHIAVSARSPDTVDHVTTLANLASIKPSMGPPPREDPSLVWVVDSTLTSDWDEEA
jgi:hypothetical protein